MDTALVRPPSPNYTAITPIARAPDKDEPATTTDLPAEDTVRPAADSTGTQRSANNEQNQQLEDQSDQQSALERFAPAVTRQNLIDPESESLIYVATNTDTGEVVRQIPSETLLRLRAYSDQIEAYRTEVEAQQRALSSDEEAVQRTA